MYNISACQNKGIDFKFYISKPSIEHFDDEFEYITSFVSPLIHLRVGADLYAKKQRFVTLHLGTVIGNERHVKPSIYEGFFSNSPEDSIYQGKTKFFSFVSFSAEYKKSFRDDGEGIYLSAEPQFSFLIFSKERVIIRHNNVVVTDESRKLHDEINSFNATLILGAGYEWRIFGRFNILLALNIEFRPIQGYYKNESHLWASNGFTLGIRYIL